MKMFIILLILIVVVFVVFFVSLGFYTVNKKRFISQDIAYKDQISSSPSLPPPTTSVLNPNAMDVIFNDTRFCKEHPELCTISPVDDLVYPKNISTEYDSTLSRYCIDLIVRAQLYAKDPSQPFPSGFTLLQDFTAITAIKPCINARSAPFGVALQDSNNRIWIVYRESEGILSWILDFLNNFFNYKTASTEKGTPVSANIADDDYLVDFGNVQQSPFGLSTVSSLYQDELPDTTMIVSSTSLNRLSVPGDNSKKLRFSPRKKVLLSKPLKSHKGFADSYKLLREQIFSVLDNLTENSEVIITGYGAGGAYATLTLLDVYEAGAKNIHVYTYASPRCLNQDISEYATSFFRVYNTADIMSDFPLASFPNYDSPCFPLYYAHSGTSVSFEQNRFSFRENHSLRAILDNVKGKDIHIKRKNNPPMYQDPTTPCPSNANALGLAWSDTRFGNEHFDIIYTPTTDDLPYPSLSTEYDPLMSRYCLDLLIRCSNAAKGTYPSAPPNIYVDKILYGVVVEKPCDLKGKNISGLIYRDTKKRVWLVFRGTSGTAEWALNFTQHQKDPYIYDPEGNIPITSDIPDNDPYNFNNQSDMSSQYSSSPNYKSFKDLPLPLKCHAGFVMTFAFFKNQLQEYMKGIPKDYDIVITGHSSGSAMSTLALILLHSMGFTNIYIYVYGTPRITNQDISSWSKCFFRIVNTTDFIISMPLAITPNFTSPTSPFYYQHNGVRISFEENRFSVIANHVLSPIINST